MSEPIAIIPKNSMDEIRIRWSDYRGNRYLNIRVYTEIAGNADKVPYQEGRHPAAGPDPGADEGTGERAVVTVHWGFFR
jgi:hypothetical protein